MADITFKVTDGPYAGVYEIEVNDYTATEHHAFREALNHSMVSAIQNAKTGGMGLEDLVGFAWLLIRRRSTNKGLPYAAVADTVSFRNLEMDDGAEAGEELAPEA